ncbi:MAG TPA: hypothetical protein VHO25_08165 [Polyangiaceae bacterium]|nr:hypothetical protein [Polyangiaceae bacterium]
MEQALDFQGGVLMSGGSYDYAYRKIEDLADEIGTNHLPTKAVREAFKAHLRKVAEAARAIEWVDSSDYARGDEVGPIREVIAPGSELVEARKQAEEALKVLQSALSAPNRKPPEEEEIPR